MAHKKQKILTIPAIKRALLPKFKTIDARFNAFDKKFDAFKRDIDTQMTSKFEAQDARIENGFKSMRLEIAELFEAQEARLDSRLDERFKTMKFELKSDLKFELLHEIKILWENDERLNALTDFMKLNKTFISAIANHEKRITNLKKTVS